MRLAGGDNGRFGCDLAEAWSLHGRPHGGYVAALIERAATSLIGRPETRLRSITVHFLRPAAIGRADIEVAVERAGRTLTTVSARLRQGESSTALGTLTYSPPWPSMARQDVSGFPAVPAPETMPRLTSAPFVVASFLERVDLRLHSEPPLYSSSARAEVTGWIRPASSRLPDAAWLITASDSFPRALTPTLAAPGPTPSPTVVLSMIIHEPDVAAVVDAGQFVLARFTTDRLHDGFFNEDGRIWSPGGTLLAQSRQLGVLLEVPHGA
jgi:acyl-CoA thioesterase